MYPKLIRFWYFWHFSPISKNTICSQNDHINDLELSFSAPFSKSRCASFPCSKKQWFSCFVMIFPKEVFRCPKFQNVVWKPTGLAKRFSHVQNSKMSFGNLLGLTKRTFLFYGPMAPGAHRAHIFLINVFIYFNIYCHLHNSSIISTYIPLID